MLSNKFYYSIAPIGVLLIAISLASIIGYGVLVLIGDVLDMDKIVSKGTQLFLVLSIFPLMKLLGLNREDIGIGNRQILSVELLQGLVTGLVTLGPVIIMLYVLDIRILDTDKIWTTGAVLKTVSISLLASFAISLLEEPVFRGILLTGMYRKLGMISSILISACYYAGLHFMKTDLEIPYRDLNIFSGFELAGDAISNLFNVDHLSAFLALVMVGVFLGVARLKAGLGLGFCIGCHTAWVLLIKTTKSMSYLNTEGDYFFLASPYDGVIGPMVSVWLIFVVAAYLGYTKYRPDSLGTGNNV